MSYLFNSILIFLIGLFFLKIYPGESIFRTIKFFAVKFGGNLILQIFVKTAKSAKFSFRQSFFPYI